MKLTNQETFTKGEKYRKHIYYTVYYTVVPSTLVQVIEETFQIVEVLLVSGSNPAHHLMTLSGWNCVFSLCLKIIF